MGLFGLIKTSDPITHFRMFRPTDDQCLNCGKYVAPAQAGYIVWGTRRTVDGYYRQCVTCHEQQASLPPEPENPGLTVVPR